CPIHAVFGAAVISGSNSGARRWRILFPPPLRGRVGRGSCGEVRAKTIAVLGAPSSFLVVTTPPLTPPRKGDGKFMPPRVRAPGAPPRARDRAETRRY